MTLIREIIDENPKEFLKAISFFAKQKTFVLEGEKYKRIIDKTKPEKIQNWYQRKNMYLVCNRKIDDTLPEQINRCLINTNVSFYATQQDLLPG